LVRCGHCPRQLPAPHRFDPANKVRLPKGLWWQTIDKRQLIQEGEYRIGAGVFNYQSQFANSLFERRIFTPH